jgi:hypothetical protein
VDHLAHDEPLRLPALVDVLDDLTDARNRCRVLEIRPSNLPSSPGK